MSTASSLAVARQHSAASAKPRTIVVGGRPARSSVSASTQSAPISASICVVPEPCSACCANTDSRRSCATGCCTSRISSTPSASATSRGSATSSSALMTEVAHSQENVSSGCSDSAPQSTDKWQRDESTHRLTDWLAVSQTQSNVADSPWVGPSREAAEPQTARSTRSVRLRASAIAGAVTHTRCRAGTDGRRLFSSVVLNSDC
eukprot:COSAG02_NODE_2354_length_9081_cov_4.549544_4_plen_204_part_00